MGDLISVVVSGMANGSAYALLALGIVIIFRSTDTVNFAIGDMGTVSVFVALSAITVGVRWRWPSCSPSSLPACSARCPSAC
ncbi:hypothetical protein [Mesorhizobium sp. J428]|uniref:hypothetical protein n=1 Tax=Mesorhizobium sp. J428 TaxID=2898440 RepID=UPI00215139E4|nr:hypothetical protein [Mesorhizobium sp. J428]MCR5859687.1 hypothetical protein [Mesorhizobium sp. J428]